MNQRGIDPIVGDLTVSGAFDRLRPNGMKHSRRSW